MKDMFTAGLFGKTTLFLASGALLSGCFQSPTSSPDKCGASGADILQAVLHDKGLREYGNLYFQREKSLVLVWDDRPLKKKDGCAEKKVDFVLKESHHLGLKDERYVVVSKMYYDETAAFVELFLYPTGKHGAFFMRNKSGWKVMQRTFWESKELRADRN